MLREKEAAFFFFHYPYFRQMFVLRFNFSAWSKCSICFQGGEKSLECPGAANDSAGKSTGPSRCPASRVAPTHCCVECVRAAWQWEKAKSVGGKEVTKMWWSPPALPVSGRSWLVFSWLGGRFTTCAYPTFQHLWTLSHNYRLGWKKFSRQKSKAWNNIYTSSFAAAAGSALSDREVRTQPSALAFLCSLPTDVEQVGGWLQHCPRSGGVHSARGVSTAITWRLRLLPPLPPASAGGTSESCKCSPWLAEPGGTGMAGKKKQGGWMRRVSSGKEQIHQGKIACLDFHGMKGRFLVIYQQV